MKKQGSPRFGVVKHKEGALSITKDKNQYLLYHNDVMKGAFPTLVKAKEELKKILKMEKGGEVKNVDTKRISELKSSIKSVDAVINSASLGEDVKNIAKKKKTELEKELSDLEKAEAEKPTKVVKKTPAKRKTPARKKKVTVTQQEVDAVKVGKSDADFDVREKDGVTLITRKHNSNWVVTVEKKGSLYSLSCCSDDMEHPTFETVGQAIEYAKEFLYCKFLFDSPKEKAKKRRSSKAKKRASDLKTDVVATLEDTAEVIENKVEQRQKQGEKFDATEKKKIKENITDVVSVIVSDISTDKGRKEFIENLIKQLQDILKGLSGAKKMEKGGEVEDSVSQIRDYINSKGGLKSFSSYDRKTKIQGRPMRMNLKSELLELSDEELNIAFKEGLIGNNNRKGSIVANAMKYAKGGEVGKVNSEINKMKTALIKKAKSKGIYENFGQKEVRQLEDKYGYSPEVASFDNWCMNFDLSQIK